MLSLSSSSSTSASSSSPRPILTFAAPSFPVPSQTTASKANTSSSQQQQTRIRSRTGCLTCKAKHSKCDETQPTCKRCASKGLVCAGYPPSTAQWTFKHLIFQQAQAQAMERPTASRISSSPPSLPTSTRSVTTVTTTTVIDNSQHSQEPPGSTIVGTAGTRKPSFSSSSSSSRSDERRGGGSRHSQKQERRRRLSSTSSSTVASHSSAAAISLHGEESIQQSPPPPPLITSFLTDNASAFIINWFQEVCPAWSGFDSDANWNRKIAVDLWQTSASVNSALESMSASFLASRLPNLRQTSLRLMSRATEFIQAELQVVKSQPVLCTIPAGVMFAMFCMATTICWVDPRGLGLPFFRELRALLRRLNAQPPTTTAASTRPSRELLDYFNRSMVYCDMLLAVVSDDQEIDSSGDDTSPLIATAPESELVRTRGAPDVLHPWTGISTCSSQLFAESVRLCRASRTRLRQPLTNTQACFSAALEDLLRAQSLEEELLALEFGRAPHQHQHHVSDTGDLSTPQSHLAMTAEAYRVSALLHLYQTFPELAFQRLPASATAAAGSQLGQRPPNDATLWTDWIVPLALHLVRILEQIPPSSGSRVIQPLLYISAATGLRHSSTPASDNTSAPSDHVVSSLFPSSMANGDGWGWKRQLQQPSLSESDTLTSYITHITSSSGETTSIPDHTTGSASPPSDLSMQISQARHFIMKRLGVFETSLPPGPILVAKELVSTIWSSYDNDFGGNEGLYMVHWIDVMELNDLRSMFG